VTVRADEAWLGLGSNLGDRESNLGDALRCLGERADIVLTSPWLETEPWGIADQPWFLNGVARLRWTGSSRDLLRLCLETEHRLGRVRGERNGPRVIDVDVLVFGERVLDEPGLVLPHPGIASRRSVLEPWSLVAPELVVPTLGESVGALAERAARMPGQGVRPWGLLASPESA